ncbi:alpha/beta hydrolase family protein [Maritalea mobilis]|nr:alpha/beta fold hydrolase [Maritalea mobilis]
MMSRRFSLGASALVGIVLVVAAFIFWLPDASYATKPITFTFRGAQISGQVALPHEKQKQETDCLVFVHGDGEMDATALGYFDPYFSQFAERGWCSFAWDKPGIGGSEGDWLNYSMEDRAALVEAAIDALRAETGLQIGRVGLIGFSQAGWVMPKVGVAAKNIDFIVFVSPAVNWMAQSDYMTQLRRSFEADPKDKMADEAKLDTLINEGGRYEDFIALSERSAYISADYFSKARWEFAVRNAHADLSEDVRRLKGVQVLLMLGGQDGQVDAQESAATFKELLPADQLTLHMFDEAGHSMVPVAERKPMSGTDGLWLLGKVMLWGSEAFVDGYWATLNEFIAAQFE